MRQNSWEAASKVEERDASRKDCANKGNVKTWQGQLLNLIVPGKVDVQSYWKNLIDCT